MFLILFCFIYLLALQVTFECNISDGRWSQSITDFDIKDRMVSFKTPIFPYPVDSTKPVDIKLQQDGRVIGTLPYFYISSRNLKNCFSYFFKNQISFFFSWRMYKMPIIFR